MPSLYCLIRCPEPCWDGGWKPLHGAATCGQVGSTSSSLSRHGWSSFLDKPGNTVSPSFSKDLPRGHETDPSLACDKRQRPAGCSNKSTALTARSDTNFALDLVRGRIFKAQHDIAGIPVSACALKSQTPTPSALLTFVCRAQMSVPIEARSLSALTNLFANPPQYPRNPTHAVHDPLVLYIVRVPGSKGQYSPLKE